MTRKSEFKDSDEISQYQLEHFRNDTENPAHLTLLAEEIKQRTISIKKNILEIGRLFAEASAMLSNEDFINFAKEHCGYSKSTAYNFINLYTHCAGCPQIVEKIKPSVLYQITSLKFPKKLRKYLLDNAEIVDSISVKEIKDISKKFTSGELTLESEEIKDLLKYNKDQDEFKYYWHEINKRIEGLKKLQSIIDSAIKKINWPTPPEGKTTILTKLQNTLVRKTLYKINELTDKLDPKADVVDELPL